MISKAVKSLYVKELTGYFKNPLGYVFLVIFLFGIGYLTFEPGRGSFFFMREASLTSFFRYIPWMLLFLVPAISMKLWAEERKSGTVELLLTMPISIHEAVIAKFFAAWTFVGISLFGTFPMVLTVLYLGKPDLAVIGLGYIASFLMGGVLLAVGSFFSAFSKNQVVSFILTICISFISFMAGSPPVLDFISSLFPRYFVDLFESLSVLNQFDSIERGVLSISNLWFFVVMIFCWLYGNIILLHENKAE